MKYPFNNFSLQIVEEIKSVIDCIDENQLDEILEVILKHKRIFISGVGRTGMIMKGFGMRLMHLMLLLLLML